MSARAYILIEAEVGRANQVVETLRALEGVQQADVITGVFDVIACVEASDIPSMANLVTAKLQASRGVLRTITCVVSG